MEPSRNSRTAVTHYVDVDTQGAITKSGRDIYSCMSGTMLTLELLPEGDGSDKMRIIEYCMCVYRGQRILNPRIRGCLSRTRLHRVLDS